MYQQMRFMAASDMGYMGFIGLRARFLGLESLFRFAKGPSLLSPVRALSRETYFADSVAVGIAPLHYMIAQITGVITMATFLIR